MSPVHTEDRKWAGRLLTKRIGLDVHHHPWKHSHSLSTPFLPSPHRSAPLSLSPLRVAYLLQWVYLVLTVDVECCLLLRQRSQNCGWWNCILCWQSFFDSGSLGIIEFMYWKELWRSSNLIHCSVQPNTASLNRPENWGRAHNGHQPGWMN